MKRFVKSKQVVIAIAFVLVACFVFAVVLWIRVPEKEISEWEAIEISKSSENVRQFLETYPEASVSAQLLKLDNHGVWEVNWWWVEEYNWIERIEEYNWVEISNHFRLFEENVVIHKLDDDLVDNQFFEVKWIFTGDQFLPVKEFELDENVFVVSPETGISIVGIGAPFPENFGVIYKVVPEENKIYRSASVRVIFENVINWVTIENERFFSRDLNFSLFHDENEFFVPTREGNWIVKYTIIPEEKKVYKSGSIWVLLDGLTGKIIWGPF